MHRGGVGHAVVGLAAPAVVLAYSPACEAAAAFTFALADGVAGDFGAGHAGAFALLCLPIIDTEVDFGFADHACESY